MKLSPAEAAALLDVAEERVLDWIEEGSLPAQEIRGVYRINRAELLEWATEQKIALAPRTFARSDDESDRVTLADSLRRGGIHYAVGGATIEQVLRTLVEELPLDDESDREMLVEFSLSRERFGLTPVGDGIAIPHVRMPLVLSSIPVVALGFLEEPLDLDAPDGVAIDTLFFLISPTVHSHLAILARIAWCIRSTPFREALERRASAEEILEITGQLERDA